MLTRATGTGSRISRGASRSRPGGCSWRALRRVQRLGGRIPEAWRLGRRLRRPGRGSASRRACRLGLAVPVVSRGADRRALPPRRVGRRAAARATTSCCAVDQGSPHYLTWQVSAIRAEIRFAHDDPAGAISDAETALAAGRSTGQPDVLCFILSACAHIYSLASDHDRASSLAREFLQALSRGVEIGFAVINLPTFASSARLLDLTNELIDVLADHPETPWTRRYEPTRMATSSPPPRSCIKPAQTGGGRSPAPSGRAAHESGPSRRRRAQLQPALDFYRSVGATRYIRDCEALLTAPA